MIHFEKDKKLKMLTSWQEALKAPLQYPEPGEDEEVRATVEAAKTDATRLQDPFISQSE